MFDWNDIRIFLSVADAGSTLGAAKLLGVNQTTVSRRVQALEHALGLSLFDRDTRGYSLTSNGRLFLENARAMNALAEEIASRAAAHVRGASGLIRVSAASDMHACWVAPVTSAFQAKHPDVSFEFDDSSRPVDLTAGEADVAFRATEAISDETLIARKLGRAPWTVYCSKAYLRQHGMPRSMADLGGLPFAFYSARMVARIEGLQCFAADLDPCQVKQTCNSTSSVASAIENNDCLGLLPVVSGETRPELVACFNDPVFCATVWLVTSRDSYQNPLTRDFMKFVGEYPLKDELTLV